MCTAYELGKRGGSFPDHVNSAAMNVLLELPDIRIIRPTLPAPVILPNGGLRTMNWGFRRSLAPKARGRKPLWRTIVNSREDKLGGPTWKESFATRRCIIPAGSFYEWVEVDRRNVPLKFERPGGEWLWIAGIWEQYPERGECFSMITTEPNDVLGPIHDRMPAVLADEQIEPFLGGELSTFGPSLVALRYEESANFLKPAQPKSAIEPPAQGELF
jgi:putative SOS response-associated peptidase YedK